MTPTSLVMPYYDNAGMLREQYRRIRALPLALRDALSVVIVDDGSPRAPAFAEDVGCSLQVYRIKVDVRWNQDAARNIGVRHAETNWVLMTDMDHIAPEPTWSEILRRDDWRDDYAYSFGRATIWNTQTDETTPYKPHPNTWFMSKKLFERVGGYDERFAGFYGTDGDFKVRLLGKATKWIQLENVVWRVPREVIPDASTTSYLRKQPDDRPAVYAMIDKRKKEADPRPRRYRFPYERVA